MGGAAAAEGASPEDIASSFFVGAGITPGGRGESTWLRDARNAYKKTPPMAPRPAPAQGILPMEGAERLVAERRAQGEYDAEDAARPAEAPFEPFVKPPLTPQYPAGQGPAEAAPVPGAPVQPKLGDLPGFIPEQPPVEHATDIESYAALASKHMKDPARLSKNLSNTADNFDLISIKGPDGKPTGYVAQRASTVLDNIIKDLTGKTDDMSAHYLKIATRLRGLPQLDVAFKVVPGLREQTGDADPNMAGRHYASTGEILVDPGTYGGERLGYVEGLLHELFHATENLTRDVPPSEGVQGAGLAYDRANFQRFYERAMGKAKTKADRDEVESLGYGRDSQHEYLATALEKFDIIELLVKAGETRSDAKKLAGQMSDRALELLTPRDASVEQAKPVPVKLIPDEKVPGRHKINLPNNGRDLGWIDLPLDTDLRAWEAKAGEDLKPSMYAQSPGGITLEMMKAAAKKIDELQKSGVRTTDAASRVLSEAWVKPTPVEKKEEDPPWRSKEEPGKDRGDSMYPEGDVDSLAKARYEEDAKGRRKYEQDELPGEGDDNTYLSVRTKDGATFTSKGMKAYSHSDLAEKLGLRPEDIKDAGFWEFGGYESSPDSNIFQWVSQMKKAPAQGDGDVNFIAKAVRGKDGKWEQPRLPDPSDNRTRLTIRMKDGTLFVDTTGEFSVHQQLVEALGVPAREVKDAGFFQNGDFRQAPYSMIAEWKAWQMDVQEKEDAAKAAEAMTPQERLMEVGRNAAKGYEEGDLMKNVDGRLETASQQLARRRREFDIVLEAKRSEDLKLRNIIYSPKKGEIERAGQEGKTALSMEFDPEVDYRSEYADLLSRVGEETSRTYRSEDIDSLSKASVKKREEAKPMPTKPAVMARFAGTFKTAEDIIKAVGGKGRFEVRLGFNPEKVPASKVDRKLLDKVGLVKQSPEYTALFEEVYKNGKDIPWDRVAEFKTDRTTWKLADMMVVKLTNNCQRANALSFYKEFGLTPSDWSITPCYGFSCWADRKVGTPLNMRVGSYESIAERGYQEASPESIKKVWTSKAFLRDALQTPFFRHGQTGDDSHSIHRGMAYEWLKAQKEAGGEYAKIKNVFISSGYAPTTPADYAKLRPFKDQFVIHFSVSGWDGFPKGETLNRMNEFKMARDAGLDAVFRVITNKDGIDARLNLKAEERPAVSMTNEKWLMDSMANAFGIEGEKGQFYILETPYHNDFLPHDVARSRAGLEFARECCKPLELSKDPAGKGAQCKQCAISCMTKVGVKWRKEQLKLDVDPNGDVDSLAKGGKPKTQEELLESRGKQIEEFIRRTSLTPEKAEEVRQLFSGDMTDVFGPGLLAKKSDVPKFGQKTPPVPSAPGVKFQKPEVPGAGEPGSDRWTPIVKRYGVKTVTEKELEDAGIEFHGTPDQANSAAGVFKGQGTLPGFPQREYASMPPPDVVKFVAGVADPKRLPIADEIETPMRFVERVGGGKNNPLKDFLYRAPKAGEDASKAASENLKHEMETKFKELGLKTNFNQSERLGRLMTQRQHLGKGILSEMGVKPVTDPTPAELEAVKWMDERYLQAFHDINAAREAADQEPIAWRKDYATFWHVAQGLEADGVSLLNAPRETIERALGKAQEEFMRTRTPEQLAKERKRSSIFFRYSQKRSGKMGPIDLDQTNVFQKYMSAAFTQMYQAESTAAAKKLIHGEWKIGGKTYKMSQDQPYLFKQMSEYLGFITGGYKGDIPADLYKAARAISSNAAVSKIGFNARSVVSQLTSNVHTLVNLGKTPQYLLKALGEDLDGVRQALMGDSSKLKFAQESGDIKWRFKDPIVDEVSKLRGKGGLVKVRAGAAKVGMAGLQFFDSITADLGWRAYYAKAMDGKVEGVAKGDKYMARTYANEEVGRTQSSASKMDLTPLQRKQWGKIATTLQNFVINEWGMVTRDVMGIRNPVMKTPERVAKVVEFYVMCALVDSLFEDVIGIRSPMNVFGSPSTIARGVIEEKKKGGNTRKQIGRGLTEFAGSIPVVGRGLQYGTDMLGVVTDPLTQVKKVGKELTKKNANVSDAAGPIIEAAGSAFGIPGAMPASRAVEAASRGGKPVEAFFGGTLPPHQTESQKRAKTFAESIEKKSPSTIKPITIAPIIIRRS